jgi:hypothetical protein
MIFRQRRSRPQAGAALKKHCSAGL